MQKLLREPLVHFVLLGIALFAGHSLYQNAVQKADYTLVVEPEELERQALIFAGENRRRPTDDDLRALLFSYVEEEVLVREAIRRGLDADDTIIRRRLAQKMRFLIEDVDPPAIPDDATLRAWFETRKDQFNTPETRTFNHIYLSPETHGEDIEAEATRLRDLAESRDWKTLGDPFMMKRTYRNMPRQEVTRLFGTRFATDIFNLNHGAWSAGVPSAFGLHVVNIETVTPEIPATFEDVKLDVITTWQEETRRTGNETRLKNLIKKYKIDVPERE